MGGKEEGGEDMGRSEEGEEERAEGIEAWRNSNEFDLNGKCCGVDEYGPPVELVCALPVGRRRERSNPFE